MSGEEARVETIARALWEADGADVRWVALASDGYTCRHYRNLARAAIAADSKSPTP